MKKTGLRIKVWIMAAFMCAFVFAQTMVVFAGSGSELSTIVVTGYTITKGTETTPYTGQLVRGDVINIKLDILDQRITSGTPVPTALVNTPSFTISGQGVHTPNAAVSSDGYLYSIQFTGVTYTGNPGNFKCSISYPTLTTPIALAYAEIPMAQCVEYIPPAPVEPTPAPEVTIKGTGFVLKDASYGLEPVYAGKPFALSATILATNGTYGVENVSVTFTLPEEMTFSDGSSVAYIGAMAPNSNKPVLANLMPGANITEGSYTISMNVDGVSSNDGSKVTATMTISVPVLQPERFEIFNSQLPTDLTAGMDDGMGYGSLTLVNQGRGVVANVAFDIIGEGLYTDEGRQYIGNVNGGAQTTADFNLHADIPGMIDAKAVVTYENVRGEQKTLEQEFTINVMEGGMDPGMIDPGMMEPGMMEPGMENPDGQGKFLGLAILWWILIAAAAAVTVTVILLKRRKKRIAATEAALDYMEDDED